MDEYADHNAPNYYEPSEENEEEDRVSIIESAYASEEEIDSNVDSSNADSSSEDSSEYSSASFSDNSSEERYENSSEESYEDNSDSSSRDRSWESADEEETGEDNSESESLDSHFLVDADGEKLDLRSTEEREEETEEDKYEWESSESSSGDDSSSSYASADDHSSEYSEDKSDSSSEWESSSREENTSERRDSEEESNSETGESSSDEKASKRKNREGLKRGSTQMSLAEWLLQILMHEEDKDDEGGYDGHDQLLLFGEEYSGRSRSGKSGEKKTKGLDLSNLLSPLILKSTEKDGSQTSTEEGLNLEYSNDDYDEDEELSALEAKTQNEGLRLGHLLLPLPTQAKGKKEEEEELLLLNLIMGHAPVNE